NTQVRLYDVASEVELSGQSIILKSATAALRKGGQIDATGEIKLDLENGFPAELDVTLTDAGYDDGLYIKTTLSADLHVSGPLLNSALLTGEVQVAEAELRLAEAATTSYGPMPDIGHVAAKAPVLATRRYAGLDQPRETGGDWRVDLNVLAPRRIFVRGRGVDAELGGEIQLGGTVANISPSGEIGLIRGRMDLLGQRLDLTEAGVVLTGSLNPAVRFTATTRSDDQLAVITATGTLEDLKFEVSSNPDLPDEEILARIIFRRAVDSLSAVQLVQLAAAAAELAGRSESSLLDTVRKRIGLDNLDIRTSETGETAAAAGAYLQENIYADVEATSSGETTVSINLDLTANTKAKASVGTDGESSVGIYFEKDY
ncbi:MAG TPA: translocation/assembly module TamB domain-containing protein, partial [Paracoccaceae bacterium]|nr:translocation/assembly module TamB domain-containing protein [Paracoccaceae bacterium]